MPRRARGKKLTLKEEAVIRDVVKSVKKGEKLDVARSVEKIYDVSSRKSAQHIASVRMRNDDFRGALLDALEERQIIGANSKSEQRLAEGLDAEAKGEVDYRTRLEYIKEIHKVAGVYAPQKSESKSVKYNMNMSEEELNEKIGNLMDELKV